MTACGPGVERIAEEVTQLSPTQRTALMTSDSLIGPHAIREMVRRVQDHEIDLLIGTQVMAKGHHFPMLTLVGVVDSDLRSRRRRPARRRAHLSASPAGRRPGRAGRAAPLPPTYMPEHPVLQALVSGDRASFYEREADERHEHGMPPSAGWRP